MRPGPFRHIKTSVGKEILPKKKKKKGKTAKNTQMLLRENPNDLIINHPHVTNYEESKDTQKLQPEDKC